MDVGTIISLAAALGIGGIIGKLIDAATSKSKDKRADERSAWADRDTEARKRRLLEEYAHRLRRLLFKHGAQEGPGEDDVPTWPTY